MGTALDPLSAPLNVRRPAARTLPSFELPPPSFNLVSAAPKFATSLPPSAPPASVSAGNLLTPPATIQPGDNATPQPVAPSTGTSELPPTYWSTSPYGPSWTSSVNAYPMRSSFSPAAGMQVRAPSDGTTNSCEAPPGYPPYHALPAPSAMPLSGPQPALTAYPGGPVTSPAPLSSNDPYPASKLPHMYAASSFPSPHQLSFPAYPPAGLGPHHTGRMPVHSPSAGQSPLGYPRQPWPSYSLPAMNGPVMSNVHSPGAPMSVMSGMQPGLLPGFHSGQVANSQHLYGGHPPHGIPAPAADRPFTCDQCPQSFNRNHDLKRHKRIHLAIKPFPCTHCDKSFSRKDALKVCPMAPLCYI